MYSYAKKIAKLCQYVKLMRYIKYILVYKVYTSIYGVVTPN